MTGIIVFSKSVDYTYDKKFSGAIDYIDRKEAINPKNNFKIKIDDTEMDNTERKILSLINKNGTSNINKLCEDTRLKNMIYYEEKLFEKN
ncbi:MAG: hypothetical protein PHX70_13755, partial [Clostridium sp.]|nr:hypothetical protein [Clostridium sp.]